MTFVSNAAGRERDQFGTRMSAGFDWSLGRMPLLFLICGERHTFEFTEHLSEGIDVVRDEMYAAGAWQ